MPNRRPSALAAVNARLPATPFASISTVSFVLQSPSTLIALNDVATPSRTSVRKTGADTRASVRTCTRSVAMSGAIIPAPFAMPAMVTLVPPTRTVRVATFGNASVVIIACAARQNPPSSSDSIAAATPRRMGSAGSTTPILPVEHGSTASTAMPSAAATCAHAAFATRMPAVPVHALALPLFVTIACARPVASRGTTSCTGAAFTRFVVTTPAATAGTSETMSARSGFPDGLIPHATPANRNPGTAIGLSRTRSFTEPVETSCGQ